MRIRWPRFLRLFWMAVNAWWCDGVPRLGAALAYYTLFALGPVLVVAIAIAGSVFGADAARGEITGQIQHLIGRTGAEAVQTLLASAAQRRDSGLATVLGTITFILASLGAFLNLQNSLNIIWRVKPKPGIDIKGFFISRLRALALVIGIGFLLLVSLAISAALAALGEWLKGGSEMVLFWRIVNMIVSLCIITMLFALIYRVLPDVRLRWRDVWVGGFVTAILFTLGKELISQYLGHTSASAYGAASSVAVLLLWVYYSAQIVLLGAEFTRVYARVEHAKPAPETFAERVDELPAPISRTRWLRHS